MKKIISTIILFAMVMQLFAFMPVTAEEAEQKYVVPESESVTYNMNFDWKFFDVRSTSADMKKDIWTLMAKADKDGKKFYETDYDDSDWESVSIPHGIGGGTKSFGSANRDAGGGYKSVLLYRKTFTVPQFEKGGKVIFELEGIRQAAYVWVNGQKVGYYEAGIAAMGFDISSYVEPGEEAVIAILNDGSVARGTYDRVIHETVPGEEWGSSYMADNYDVYVGNGVSYVWNTSDFNEPQIGLIYDAFLHIKGSVYQTLPLYNNLKTTGTYVYADNFNIRENKATINVETEVRNESAKDGDYSVEVNIVDSEGNLKYVFESEKTTVVKATDAGEVYQTAVEANVYDETNIQNAVGLTDVKTPDVTYIKASYNAQDVRFWSTEDPYLYTVYTVLKDSDGKVVDVNKVTTGFRKVTYDANSGILINDRAVWLTGYAQRSTNEWAVIGSATDWLWDYDMSLVKENNANFIRWMHVAPKPPAVRSSDKYGVAVVVPAGDKEGIGLTGRQWSQRTEAMRDVMIYFRNSPSVLFWETGNSAVGSAENANEMAALRDKIDPNGMRFIGARSTTSANQMNYEYNYAGTMYGGNASAAKSGMQSNGIMGPIMETEYARNESPRRVWDDYSPPDYDYVNKFITKGGKEDGYDVWDQTQEDIVRTNVKEYNDYYSNRAGSGNSYYSAAAMMIWSDSNMHTRNTASENCRTSGRVDPVRQKKEMFEGTRVAQSQESAVHIVGHWSYPELSADTYNYYNFTDAVIPKYIDYEESKQKRYKVYTDEVLKRDPTSKTVYVIGSNDVAKVELYRVDGDKEILLGSDETAESNFIYSFDGIDITVGDGVIARAYDARNTVIATDEIERTYEAASIRLTPHTAVKENEQGEAETDWRADGSDIAYIDVEVIDKNGNVCALNYDKINFTYSGEGVYLGGYNSGSGAGCFQNTAGTEKLSSYFAGAKDGVTTLGKDYVYAENGTNRIFVRSTRNAGAFTLTASMDGILPVSVTIESDTIEIKDGLSTVMASSLAPDASEPPSMSNVAPMKPLMKKKLISWADVKVETETDTTTYYDVYLNGKKFESGAKTYLGLMDTLFGPVYEILKAVEQTGTADFTMEYDETSPAKLIVTAGGHTYQYTENLNAMITDGSELTECIDTTVVIDGVMIANLEMMFEKAGVGYSRDDNNQILNITTN